MKLISIIIEQISCVIRTGSDGNFSEILGTEMSYATTTYF